MLNQSRNPSFILSFCFSNAFILRFRGPRKEKKNHRPVSRRPPHLPAQSAISSTFMVRTFFKKKIGFGVGPDLTIIGV
jgi:hypothetical protein